jgi:hypothetical protein
VIAQQTVSCVGELKHVVAAYLVTELRFRYVLLFQKRQLPRVSKVWGQTDPQYFTPFFFTPEVFTPFLPPLTAAAILSVFEDWGQPPKTVYDQLAPVKYQFFYVFLRI